MDRAGAWRLTAVPLVVAAAFFASGCFGPSVYGAGPVKGCGTADRPVLAVLGGNQVTWVGTEFTAGDGGAVVWIEGTEADLGDWWGQDIDAWTVFAVDPNGTQPVVVDGRAGLAEHGATYTAVHVGPYATAVQDDAHLEPTDRYQLVDPITLKEGQRLLLFAASAATAAHIALDVYWKGCGQTHEIYGGIAEGQVVSWDDLQAPLLAASGTLGAAAYDASWSMETGDEEGVVLAHAPPGDPLYGGSSAATSRGTVELNHELSFLPHDGGGIGYEATYAGGPGAAQGPLLVWIPVPISELHGPIQQEKTEFDWSGQE